MILYSERRTKPLFTSSTATFSFLCKTDCKSLQILVIWKAVKDNKIEAYVWDSGGNFFFFKRSEMFLKGAYTEVHTRYQLSVLRTKAVHLWNLKLSPFLVLRGDVGEGVHAGREHYWMDNLLNYVMDQSKSLPQNNEIFLYVSSLVY